MWRRLARPDVLFLVGTLQALIPYGALALGLVPEITKVIRINYTPVAIWCIGYASFWFGTRVIRPASSDSTSHASSISLTTSKVLTGLLTLVCIGQMVSLARVYGGIPLLMFASGGSSVGDTNAAQADSGFGQVGLAALSLSMLVCCLALLALKARQQVVSVVPWLVTGGLTALILCVFNGKRQGLLQYALLLAITSIIFYGNPTEILSALFGTRNVRLNPKIITVVGIPIVLLLLSSLASLRNNGNLDASGTDVLGSYYLYPALGMSLQADQAGLGPYEFKPIGVIVPLLPAKLNLPANLVGSPPPRFELTSPSGFYELLQWHTGLWGILPFTFCCGAFSQAIFNLAHRRYAALLSYGFISWALFSAPLYNHFLNLLALPLPMVLIWTISFLRRETVTLLSLSKAHARSH